MMQESVLLTGISGYIGLHCAQQLLNKGYKVVGSVRNKNKQQEVLKTLTDANVDISNLSIVELDLTRDEGWDVAAMECHYLMHIASPFIIANPKSENEIITPAVEGTLRALRAANKAGIKKVVLTSSILAMMGSMKTGTFTQDDWTDTNNPEISTYTKSKTLAEQAAWQFINDNTAESNMELVCINPGAVFGPPLGKDITGQSMTMMQQMLKGKMPMLPNSAFPMVDVRDVATLHVRAMISDQVSGKRIIAASANPISFSNVAKILIKEGYKGPSTRIAPNFLIKLMAIFDREAKGMIGLLDMNLSSNNSQTVTLLNWQPIPLKQTVLDTAVTLNKIG